MLPEGGVVDDVRVYLDIAQNGGTVKVFVKVNNDSEDFDTVNWTQLYKDGDTGLEWPTDVEEYSLTPMTFKPATGTSVGEFSVYAIKIVVCSASSSISENDMPVIKNLRATVLQT